jgi:hypothetical protein
VKMRASASFTLSWRPRGLEGEGRRE